MAQPERDRQTAVALAYHGGDFAPRVVAKGKGLIAEAIIEAASAPDANNNNRRVVEGETQEEEPSVENH